MAALPGLACSAFVILLVCSSSFGVQHKLHEVMSKSQLMQFFGDEQGPKYDLVTPTARDVSGQFLSNQLHLTGDVLNERRQRRHVDNADEDKAFLHLSAFGEDHHMQLTRNHLMVHPQFSINVHEGDGSMRTHTVDTDCYHHGQLSGQADSEIAMATCDGELMGTIRRKREIFHVHPLPSSLRNHDTHNPDGHTHIIHLVRKKKQGDSGFNENAEKMRERAKRQVDLSPINSTHFCPEDGMLSPPITSASEQARRRNVDMSDTLVLERFEPRRVPVSNEFGNSYVHAAIFIDHTMVEKYDGDEAFLVRYHLVMFNLVNLIWQPYRSRYPVYIIIINLRIFRRPQPGLFITQDSSRLLDSFCTFQMRLNPGIGHPMRWNHAFLVTGYGLCNGEDRDCGERGRAWIEGVCLADRECSVNRDFGLSTGFVMAHELGHNLGIFHDGHPTEANDCPSTDGFIMSPSTSSADRLWEFSRCSKDLLRTYLRNDFSACVDKGPLGPTRRTDLTGRLQSQCAVPPGRLYPRDEQCRLTFRNLKRLYHVGHSFKYCSRKVRGRDEICFHLFCDDGNRNRACLSSHTPAMDGTVCGVNRVCWKYNCVEAHRIFREGNYCAPVAPGPTGISGFPEEIRARESGTPPPPVPVDGSWSFFSAFSECSRTCGGGIRFRDRRCNSPENGGRPCEGNSRMFEICNNDPCPGGRSLRATRCRQFAPTFVESLNRADEDPCHLYCEERDPNGSVVRRQLAAVGVDDGTRCRAAQGGNDRCIRDQCMVVGCDDVINSTAREDECGVCNGVGGTCRLWSGSVSGTWTRFGFFPIQLRGTAYSIPAGSSQIRLNFTNPTSSPPANLMILRDNNPVPSSRTYFFHGPGTPIRTGLFPFSVAGTMGQYSNIAGQMQRISIPEETNTPLVLEVLYFPTRGSPATVEFSFRSNIIAPSESLFWVTTEAFGECSVTCGRGVETKSVRCLNNATGNFQEDIACIRAGRPIPVVERECARAPCGSTARFQRLQETTDCDNCTGQMRSFACVFVNDVTGETQNAPPRMCDRFQRMATVLPCPRSTCTPEERFCQTDDTSPACAFFEGKDCPTDMVDVCSQSCKACATVSGNPIQ